MPESDQHITPCSNEGAALHLCLRHRNGQRRRHHQRHLSVQHLEQNHHLRQQLKFHPVAPCVHFCVRNKAHWIIPPLRGSVHSSTSSSLLSTLLVIVTLVLLMAPSFVAAQGLAGMCN
jgi:hypothetical protein